MPKIKRWKVSFIVETADEDHNEYDIEKMTIRHDFKEITINNIDVEELPDA